MPAAFAGKSNEQEAIEKEVFVLAFLITIGRYPPKAIPRPEIRLGTGRIDVDQNGVSTPQRGTRWTISRAHTSMRFLSQDGNHGQDQQDEKQDSLSVRHEVEHDLPSSERKSMPYGCLSTRPPSSSSSNIRQRVDDLIDFNQIFRFLIPSLAGIPVTHHDRRRTG
jgi:hypothetical protein